jgi:hypothetical protein
MKYCMMWFACLLLALVVVGCSEQAPVAPTDDSTSAIDKAAVARSFDEFLAAQGTYCWPGGDPCFVFNPPVPNYAFWYEPNTLLSMWPDYAGVAAAWLEEESGGMITVPTMVTGSVTERPLPDGHAMVHVRLRAENAMTWAFDYSEEVIAPESVWLGSMPQEVLEGAQPSLGEVEMNLRFVNTAPGAPLPDLIEVEFFPSDDIYLVFLQTTGHFEGEFRDVSGYPEGTPGFGSMSQVFVGQANAQNPNWDGWPAEVLFVRPLGQ